MPYTNPTSGTSANMHHIPSMMRQRFLAQNGQNKNSQLPFFHLESLRFITTNSDIYNTFGTGSMYPTLNHGIRRRYTRIPSSIQQFTKSILQTGLPLEIFRYMIDTNRLRLIFERDDGRGKGSGQNQKQKLIQNEKHRKDHDYFDYDAAFTLPSTVFQRLQKDGLIPYHGKEIKSNPSSEHFLPPPLLSQPSTTTSPPPTKITTSPLESTIQLLDSYAPHFLPPTTHYTTPISALCHHPITFISHYFRFYTEQYMISNFQEFPPSTALIPDQTNPSQSSTLHAGLNATTLTSTLDQDTERSHAYLRWCNELSPLDIDIQSLFQWISHHPLSHFASTTPSSSSRPPLHQTHTPHGSLLTQRPDDLTMEIVQKFDMYPNFAPIDTTGPLCMCSKSPYLAEKTTHLDATSLILSPRIISYNPDHRKFGETPSRGSSDIKDNTKDPLHDFQHLDGPTHAYLKRRAYLTKNKVNWVSEYPCLYCHYNIHLPPPVNFPWCELVEPLMLNEYQTFSDADFIKTAEVMYRRGWYSLLYDNKKDDDDNNNNLPPPLSLELKEKDLLHIEEIRQILCGEVSPNSTTGEPQQGSGLVGGGVKRFPRVVRDTKEQLALLQPKHSYKLNQVDVYWSKHLLAYSPEQIEEAQMLAIVECENGNHGECHGECHGDGDQNGVDDDNNHQLIDQDHPSAHPPRYHADTMIFPTQANVTANHHFSAEGLSSLMNHQYESLFHTARHHQIEHWKVMRKEWEGTIQKARNKPQLTIGGNDAQQEQEQGQHFIIPQLNPTTTTSALTQSDLDNNQLGHIRLPLSFPLASLRPWYTTTTNVVQNADDAMGFGVPSPVQSSSSSTATTTTTILTQPFQHLIQPSQLVAPTIHYTGTNGLLFYLMSTTPHLNVDDITTLLGHQTSNNICPISVTNRSISRQLPLFHAIARGWSEQLLMVLLNATIVELPRHQVYGYCQLEDYVDLNNHNILDYIHTFDVMTWAPTFVRKVIGLMEAREWEVIREGLGGD